MEERMMDVIVEIYNHMDDSDKDAFTLEDAEDMVEDQIRMDKEAGREPLAYDPQFFYDTIVELMEQDVECCTFCLVFQAEDRVLLPLAILCT